jgi:phosphoglycerate dehydrogenase-like enzyme
VAEHTIALLLAAAKRLDVYSADRMRAGGWFDEGVRPRMLKGRTLGLVGFGRIAREVARRLEPWGIEIIAHDIVEVSAIGAVRIVGLDELLAISDFVSFHVPGSPHGAPLLDRESLSRLKPGAIIVNTARGELVDQDALSDALSDGRVSVAGLDVFDPEPPRSSDDLFQRTNLIPTPHTAAMTDEAEHGMELMAVTNLAEMMQGLDPDALVTARPSPNEQSHV